LTVKEKDKAIKLFKEALDIYSSNDAHHHAADVYRAFNTFLIKEKLFDEAIANVEKQVITYQQLKQDHNKFKGMLAIMILRLKTGDWVKASNTLESWRDTESGFVYSDEGQIAQGLLDAFEANSEDQLQKVLKNSKIRLLENQIAKVALSLKCSDDPSAKTRVNTPKEKVVDSKKQALFGDSDDDVEEKVEEPQESVFDDNDAR
jgi:tetratricopeptide (TPR) repeat protein